MCARSCRSMMEGGVNCLFPFEVNGCAHPAELLNEYGKDLRIMGGFDKIELGKGREAITALHGYAGAAGGARRVHPLLRPPLPAQRATRTITCITWI